MKSPYCPLAFIVILPALSPAPCLTAAPVAFAGPLVGHLTPTTAKIWMFAPEGATVSVKYQLAGPRSPGLQAAFTPVEQPAAQMGGLPATVTLEGLAPNTRYRYGVTLNGQTDDIWEGAFKTPPRPGTPHRFRVALTSCMGHEHPQDSWKLLLAEKPDFHLTLGDTHYADTTDPKVQWENHLRYRRSSEFAEVIRNVPTLAMWDDHDYGPNDSDGTTAGKEESLTAWKQIWANPPCGTPELPGAFFAISWGEVDFFVVDGRYYRTPNTDPDDDSKRMLGDAQFAWLLDGLGSSKAKFKVIASGSTLHHSEEDGWRLFTFARHRLFDAIKTHRIAGVVYLSGDLHRSLVWEHPESSRVGYPLVEVISSGIANSETLSFATVDFDTTVDDPTMRVRTIVGTGKVEMDRMWKLSELTPGGP